MIQSGGHAGHYATLGVAEQTDGGHIAAGANVPQHGDEILDLVQHVHVGEVAVAAAVAVEIETQHGHAPVRQTIGDPLVQTVRVGVHAAAESMAQDHDGAWPVMVGSFEQSVQTQAVAADGQFHVGPFR